MKKRFFRAILAAMLLASLVTPSFAAESAVTAEPESRASQGPVVRADQFVVHFKTINGVEYYRVWNATKAEWATDWLVY